MIAVVAAAAAVASLGKTTLPSQQAQATQLLLALAETPDFTIIPTQPLSSQQQVETAISAQPRWFTRKAATQAEVIQHGHLWEMAAG